MKVIKSPMNPNLEFVGTERYKDERSTIQEISYYAKPGFLETRKLSRTRDKWLVDRYLVAKAQALQVIVAQIKELAGKEIGSKSDHDQLGVLLQQWPSVAGFVTLDEIDNPRRRVTIAGARNLPKYLMRDNWLQLFTL